MSNFDPASDAVLREAATAYNRAVAEGFLPLGVPVGTGRRSAVHVVAAAIGVSHSCAYRRIKRARDAGLTQAKPRVRVKARSAEAPAPPTQAERWLRQAPMQPAHIEGPQHTFHCGHDGSFVFGACGDLHAGSKYERLDVIEALYDAYEDAGCQVVFNTGNWIDGEARFNVHDIHTRGMDAQLRYLAKVYPHRAGITTYAVAGDDHEGWYAAREGVDIGRHAERTFRDVGRTDWIDLGYMEAPVLLEHPRTRKSAVISVTHPGGGSAYALSYSVQKIIESLDGGEKPAILLAGHFHKLWFGNIRNVWAIQTGCQVDQTPFMRKRRLEAHIGGCIVRVTQDPESGAIIRCSVEILRYFHRGFYANRWNHHGSVSFPEIAR